MNKFNRSTHKIANYNMRTHILKQPFPFFSDDDEEIPSDSEIESDEEPKKPIVQLK
jgi:hypothetical protein